ncbi:MAG: hypothetical protein GX221_00020 [Candidatus Riflebacteria bacterium]|nr:hypothetical protein [Candidatus Riflebacteria bacterium]
MKLASKALKLDYLILFFLALLFLLPLLGTRYYLFGLAERETFTFETSAKEYLYAEADRLKEQLSPDLYAASVFESMADLLEVSEEPLFPNNDLLLQKLNEKYEKDFSLSPSFIGLFEVSSGRLYSFHGTNKPKKIRTRPLQSLLSVYNGDYLKQLDYLKDNNPAAYFNEPVLFSLKFNGKETYFPVTFFNDNGIKGYLFVRFLNNNKNAAFVVYLTEISDIPYDEIVKHALENSNYTKILKTLEKGSLEYPYFATGENEVLYHLPFPDISHNYLRQFKNINPALYEHYSDFFANNHLKISLQASLVNLKIKKLLQIVNVSILLICILLLIAMTALHKGVPILRINLSKKITLMIVSALIIPSAGFFSIYSLASNELEKVALDACKEKISLRFNFFEKKRRDMENAFSLQSETARKVLGNISSNMRKTGRKSPTQAERSEFNKYIELDKTRILFSNGYIHADRPEQNVILYFLVEPLKIFSKSLRGFVSNMEKRLLNLYIFPFEEVMRTVFSPNVLPKMEGLISQGLESISRTVKGIAWFFSEEETPQQIAGMAYLTYLHRNQELHFFRNLFPKNEYLTCEEFDGVKITYCVSRKEKYMPVVLEESELNKYRDVFTYVLSTGSSGSSLKRDGNKLLYNEWQVRDDFSIAYMAKAEIDTILPKPKLWKLLPFMFSAFIVLSLLLSSNYLSSSLILPVNQLSDFVRRIEKGDYTNMPPLAAEKEFADLSQSFNNMANGLSEREAIKRFIPASLYTTIKSEEKSDKILQRNATALFSDIRSFTTITENNSAKDIVELLNEYFTAMESAILANGGRIEKMIGDAIVATFYEPDDTTASVNHALLACRGALAMRLALKTFNANRIAAGKFPIETGIGLATGSLLSGFAGSGDKKHFLLVGDLLETAEQMEGQTKKEECLSKIYADLPTIEAVNGTYSFILGDLGGELEIQA